MTSLLVVGLGFAWVALLFSASLGPSPVALWAAAIRRGPVASMASVRRLLDAGAPTFTAVRLGLVLALAVTSPVFVTDAPVSLLAAVEALVASTPVSSAVLVPAWGVFVLRLSSR